MPDRIRAAGARGGSGPQEPGSQEGFLEECCGGQVLGPLPDEAVLRKVIAQLKGFADPTRLKILCLLADREVCVHDLVAALGITQSGVSHQLRALRDADLVIGRRSGRQVYYRLADEHVRQMLSNALSHGAHGAYGANSASSTSSANNAHGAEGRAGSLRT